jgi:hypothetical protein
MLKLALAFALTRYVFDVEDISLLLASFDRSIPHQTNLIQRDHSLYLTSLWSMSLTARQSKDQNNPNKKLSTITIYDDKSAPYGYTDKSSDLGLSEDFYPIRQGTNQIDLALEYYQGVFAKNIGGTVGFPRTSSYKESKYFRPDPFPSLAPSAD